MVWRMKKKKDIDNILEYREYGESNLFLSFLVSIYLKNKIDLPHL